ncbi:MAG: TRAP transporter large permease subunit, partial [Betaproteobacteria bacterium]
DASGVPRARGAALVCVASTLGVVVPPSLVLILLGDAMMRAHTEATNVTHAAVRIMNTQDVFLGVLGPAALLLALTALVAWWQGRHRADVVDPVEHASPRAIEWVLALGVAALIVALFAGVMLGYLFAVEAAATGGIALFAFGVVTRTLTIGVLRDVLRDTMAITGALFALLVAATMFTLVLRALGTDRWLVEMLAMLPGGGIALLVVMAIVAACALVLDAFEMIFVVIPIVMPPLLMVVHDAPWVAVLTLLILQTSFLMPPFGYAVLLTCQLQREPQPLRTLMGALAPYLAVQWLVVALVVALPILVWQSGLVPATAMPGAGGDPDAGRDALIEMLRQQEPDEPAPPSDEPARAR